MWIQKDKQTERRPLLESNWIRWKKGRASTKHVRGRKGRRGTEWRGEVVRLTDPVTQLVELPFMKNVLVALGEKFVDPQEEGLFLDVN